jgi:hypothetical protein
MTETVVNEVPRSARAWGATIGRRWPSVLGLAAAAAGGYELVGGTAAEGIEQAVFIAVPVLVYLTAAVIDRPRSAWPVAILATILVFGMRASDVEPVLALAAASAVVLALGLVRRLWSGVDVPATGQIIGALGFGAAAVLALYTIPTLGALVVGFGLLGHAAWDVFHHRRARVVVRSLAEWCAVLDLLLGGAVILLTVTTII